MYEKWPTIITRIYHAHGESIPEVCFPKNEFLVNFQEAELLEDFLEFLKICMEKQMQNTRNYAEMAISYIR